MARKITKDEIEKDAVDLVLKTKEHFRQLRYDQGYEGEWQQSEETYYNGVPGFYKGVAQVRSGILHSHVERIVPKMDKVVFPPDGEFIGARAKDPDNELEVQNAESATALLKEQLNDIGTRAKLVGAYRDECIYGTVFLKTRWRRDQKERYKRVDGRREKVWDITFDNPDFEIPSIWDIYIDPKDENLEGALIESIDTDYHHLWNHRERIEDGETAGVYKNVDLVKDFKIERTEDSNKQISENIRGVGAHHYGPHEHKIRVYEYWGDVPLYFFTGSNEDKEALAVVRDALIVIAVGGGSGVALRISDNPFDHQEKPYLRGRYLKINGRAYGLGIISRVTIPLEQELNTLRTQAMDDRTFLLRTKWLKDRVAGISDAALEDLTAVVIETNDMNGLQALRPPDFTATTITAAQHMQQNIEDVTGASRLLSGTPSGGSLDRTAAGIATVVSAGLEKFELVITMFEEEVLKQLVRHFWMLDQQFLDEGRAVSVAGKGLVKVLPQEIPYNFSVNFIGIKELGQKEYMVNSINILLQNLQPYIPLGLDPLPILFRLIRMIGHGDLIQEIDQRQESALEYTPEGEVRLLRVGRKVRVDFNDEHDKYILAYQQLLQEPGLPDNVKQNTLEALGQRFLAKRMVELTVAKQLFPENAPVNVRE